MNTALVCILGALFALLLAAFPAQAVKKVDQSGRGSGPHPNGYLFKHNGYVQPYVPQDIRHATAGGKSSRCTEDGAPTREVGGNCTPFVSDSKGVKLVIRFIEPRGSAERIFLVGAGGQLSPHVRFDKNNGFKAVDISPLAQKYAQENGAAMPAVANSQTSKPTTPAAVATATGSRSDHRPDGAYGLRIERQTAECECAQRAAQGNRREAVILRPAADAPRRTVRQCVA